MNSKELNLAIKIMTTYAKSQSLRVEKETYTLYSEALKLELNKEKSLNSTTSK